MKAEKGATHQEHRYHTNEVAQLAEATLNYGLPGKLAILAPDNDGVLGPNVRVGPVKIFAVLLTFSIRLVRSHGVVQGVGPLSYKLLTLVILGVTLTRHVNFTLDNLDVGCGSGHEHHEQEAHEEHQEVAILWIDIRDHT